jgi:uncharacterized membrane protein (DUF485 family)
MKLLEPGTEVDGFVVASASTRAAWPYLPCGPTPTAAIRGFPMAMKIPRMTAGDGAENIVSFEVEHQILPTLTGPHVPRFVAAGDLMRLPYLVMEYVEGQHAAPLAGQPPRSACRARPRHRPPGRRHGHAAHSLHQQNAVPPRPEAGQRAAQGRRHGVVLLDFGLSCHAHYPDLLAEEMRKAVGSPAWIAPEQVVGVRGDPRSDIFAIGVMLYELATGELPFGAPTTQGGLRQRLWMTPATAAPAPPDLPEWLQEVILRCLEPEAASATPRPRTWPSTWRHPEQVQITERGQRTARARLRHALKRWFKAAGMHYQPSPLPARQIDEVPILMVAVPHDDVTDATLYSLREAVARSLGIRPGARLACVTVISPSPAAHRQRAQRDHAAPPPPGAAQAMGRRAGPVEPQRELPRARIRRRGPGPGALRRGQPREHDDSGRRHPWPAHAARGLHHPHPRGARPMSDPMVQKIQSHPKYLELRTKRNRLGIFLTALMLIVYYGYIALIAFDKKFLAQPIGTGVTTLGIPIGMGVIIFTIVITAIYVRRANGEFDTLTKEILKDAAQ